MAILTSTLNLPRKPVTVPTWVPVAALNYLAHTEVGEPIRELARRTGCHASTILRQIRRLEMRRDDLLVDHALRRLGHAHFHDPVTPHQIYALKETSRMNAQTVPPHPDRPATGQADQSPSESLLKQEARRILRRLCESGAVLAVAADMEKAVVVRDGAAGDSTRTAVVDRAVAEAMALKDWIACANPGRIARYAITSAGRLALSQLLAEAENAARQGLSEAQSPFAMQHRVWGEKAVEEEEGSSRRMRYNMGESPLTALARRRDKDGTPFLADDLVRAGERLREDFETAQMGPRVAQNWDRFLTGADRGSFGDGPGGSRGAQAARDRVAAALRDLGPGLGDVALRCCCYLEGLETAERRMGWSARSGKIVLRIALQRLKRHYDGLGPESNLIG